MSVCRRAGGRKRKVCTGDLNKQITLQNRNITAPIWNSTDFGETFSGDSTVWANIQTVTGKTFFDSVNQRDTTITHEIYIRYDSTVTSETWILYDSRRLDIVAVENLEERNEWLKLTCVDKGISKV
jgi:SPP1 family predicted phage head-tail adaptor